MHGSVPRLEKWLQRECGDPELRLRWDSRTERYVIGRRVSSLASDIVEWFYTVTDGNSGYRPIDQRTVRKVKSLDTWSRPKRMTEKDFVQQLEDRRLTRSKERSAMLQYRLKHDARYIKRVAEAEGLV